MKNEFQEFYKENASVIAKGWVTINGQHILMGEDGEVKAGNPKVMGGGKDSGMSKLPKDSQKIARETIQGYKEEIDALARTEGQNGVDYERDIGDDKVRDMIGENMPTSMWEGKGLSATAEDKILNVVRYQIKDYISSKGYSPKK